jgi:hypothetical protein
MRIERTDSGVSGVSNEADALVLKKPEIKENTPAWAAKGTTQKTPIKVNVIKPLYEAFF